MTEHKAIDGCKRQDRICQKYLFDAYSDKMLMVCVRYVKSLPDAEELMLNGFMKFYQSIDRFSWNSTGGVGGWLRGIMINECLMFLRKKGGFKIIPEAWGVEISETERILAGIHAGEIFKMILELPVGYRTVFNLYVMEGYAHKEIATLLGISEGTSKSQLNRAKAMLQVALKKSYT